MRKRDDVQRMGTGKRLKSISLKIEEITPMGIIKKYNPTTKIGFFDAMITVGRTKSFVTEKIKITCMTFLKTKYPESAILCCNG
jgi:hypothetical protein